VTPAPATLSTWVIDLPGIRAGGVHACVSPLVTLMATIFEGGSAGAEDAHRAGCATSGEPATASSSRPSRVYCAPRRVTPDFTAPSTLVSARSIDQVLVNWRTYEPARVRGQISETFSDDVPPSYRAYVTDPSGALGLLCDAIVGGAVASRDATRLVASTPGGPPCPDLPLRRS
jgi:hypothetical protein